MLAIAFCVTAVIYLYAAPTIRRCCHKNRRPIPAEVINEYGDL